MSKKEKILCSAQCLMLDKGFVAATVDDICENAGVTKGSFFYYFKDKEQLGKELVQRFAENGQKLIFEGPIKEEPDPLKRVYGYLDVAIQCSQKTESKGCLVGIFSSELSETHPEIRKICEMSFNTYIKRLEKDLAEAKKKYVPKASFKARELAEYFLATIQGSMILARAKKDKGVIKRAVNQYREHLKLLFEG